jgi:hypothetical protein
MRTEALPSETSGSIKINTQHNAPRRPGAADFKNDLKFELGVGGPLVSINNQAHNRNVIVSDCYYKLSLNKRRTNFMSK